MKKIHLSHQVNSTCLLFPVLLLLSCGIANAQPVISSLSSLSGTPGAPVTINGSGFNVTPANNIVYFGATKASVSSASASSLTVSVPTDATFMPVTVTNTATSLTGYSLFPFIPTFNTAGLETGTFNFASKVNFVSTYPHAIALADLDGDGKTDMVVCNNTVDYISIYRNISTTGSITTSSFAAKVDFATIGSAQNTKVTIADIDGDGKKDIIVGYSFSTSISVFRNTSTSGAITTSSFAARVDFSLSNSVNNIAVNDMNMDGKPDLVLATGATSGIFAILQNNSTAGAITTSSFSSPINISISPYTSTNIATGDIDGDGKPDVIATTNSASNICILRNNMSAGATITSSSFDAHVDFATAITSSEGLVIADLDGDGKLDIAASGSGGSDISIFRNTATSGVINSSSLAARFDMHTSTYPKYLMAADMNGDSKPDLVVMYNYSADTISIFRNTSTSGTINSSSFAPRLNFGFATSNYTGIAIGDLDGDNKPDVAVSTTSPTSQLSVFKNTPLTTSTGGGTAICVGGTVTLSNATSGGTWSSSNTSVATVGSNTGIVTGAGAGTALISYSVGVGITTMVVTVNSSPAAIGGSMTVCAGATTTLSNSTTGGTWSSSNTSAGTIDVTSGVLYGVAAGTSVITYSVGASCYTTTIITVNTAPDAGIITGTFTVCPTTTITLSSSVSGGSWTSGATGIATVGTGGIVTGVSGGTALISYSVSNSCATTVTTQIVTVNTLPATGTITGGLNICVSGSATLSETVTGGAWSSDATSIATVNSAGSVSGVAAGTATISYTSTNGCGSAAATAIVTVSTMPVAGSITGTLSVCQAATTSLGATPAGGTWSTSTAAIATVGTTGTVNGVSSGIATISYSVTNVCGTAFTTSVVTVNPLPNAGAISGAATVCVGTTTTLSNATADAGTWASSATSIATIGSTGTETGVATGSAVITYTAANGCGLATATFNTTVIAPTAGNISGPSSVCAGSSITLSESVSGGTWSSSAAGIATAGSTGIVTGVSSGTATISYSANNGCGLAIVTKVVTVNPLPVAGTLSGMAAFCAGTTITLTTTGTAGNWSSGATSVATVGSTGVVNGVAGGTTTISYTVINTCGTSTATGVVTVNPAPNAGTITGGSSVCPGAAITLSTTGTGGVWTSNATTIATVAPISGFSSSTVTGISAGTVTISYSVSNGCGSAFAVKAVTVNPLPDAGTVSGTPTVCVSATTLLSTSASGGGWTSGSAHASVSSAGLVTGVSAGTAIISYVVSNVCGSDIATATITVNPLPAAGIISGAGSVCAGSTDALTDLAADGSWSSSSASVATVGTSGIVTGISAGTSTISYTVTNVCGTDVATSVITVNPLPDAGAITGPSTVCEGATIVLNDAAAGTWSISGSAATISASGGICTVNALAAGTATVTYTATNVCGTDVVALIITVNPLPDAGIITGGLNVCTGATSTLSDVVTGGTWSSASTAIATISSAGLVSGITAGTAAISYSITNVCGTDHAIVVVTVNALPDAGAITGTSVICVGNNLPLSDAVSGGAWSSSSPAVVTVSTTGVITGVAAGTATISYTFTNTCGTDVAVHAITVNPLPDAGTIVGTDSVCIGDSVALADAVSGGIWSSSNISIAVVNSAGRVIGVSAGSASITYSVTNSCGIAHAAFPMSVNSCFPAGTPIISYSTVNIHPNPTSGQFVLEVHSAGIAILYSLEGKEIQKWNIKPGDNVLDMPSGIAAGVYTCRYSDSANNSVIVKLVYQP